MYGKKNSELYEQLKRGLLGVGMKQHQATSQDMSGHWQSTGTQTANVLGVCPWYHGLRHLAWPYTTFREGGRYGRHWKTEALEPIKPANSVRLGC